MRSLVRKIGITVLALVIAFAITGIGQNLWGVMAFANLKVSPAVPWTAVLMPLVLAGLVLVLTGRGWPRWGAETRRTFAPFSPVSKKAWTWTVVSGAVGVAFVAALWTVMATYVRVPPNVLPDMTGVPVWTQAALLLVASAVSPITEEIAFRGYAMGLLKRAFGPAGVLVLSSLMFMAAHLNQGLYVPKLIVYFLVGLALGAIVMPTNCCCRRWSCIRWAILASSRWSGRRTPIGA